MHACMHTPARIIFHLAFFQQRHAVRVSSCEVERKLRLVVVILRRELHQVDAFLLSVSSSLLFSDRPPAVPPPLARL